MTIFFTLLLAHLIADFPLQTNWIYAMKLKSNVGLVIHVLIHLIITSLLIREPLTHWPLLAIIGTLHFLFDWLKLRYPTQKQVPGFLTDQALHLSALLFGSVIFTNVQTVLSGWWLYVALLFAFVPPIIMIIWLLAIDVGRVRRQTDWFIFWAQRNLLMISQHAGVPLLLVVGLGILLI